MGSLFDLTGRSALITGSGTGIGAAVAEALAVSGAAVLVSDVDADAASAVAERICAALLVRCLQAIVAGAVIKGYSCPFCSTAAWTD